MITSSRLRLVAILFFLNLGFANASQLGVCQIQIVELPGFTPLYQSLSTQIYPMDNCEAMEPARCEMWWPSIFAASAILNDPILASIKLKLGTGAAIPQLRFQCLDGGFRFPIPEPVTQYRQVPVPQDFTQNYKEVPRLTPQPQGVPIDLWQRFIRVYEIVLKYSDVIGWWVMSLIIVNILLALAASGPSAGTSFAAAFAAILALLIYVSDDFSPQDRDYLRSLPQASNVGIDEATRSMVLEDGTRAAVVGSEEDPSIAFSRKEESVEPPSARGK